MKPAAISTYPWSTNFRVADDASAATGALLTAFAVLAAIAYAMPLSESWAVSTYDNYVDLERLVSEASEGDRTRQLAIASQGLLGVLVLATSGLKRLRVIGALGAGCVAFYAWCVLSCLWADEPMLTFRRIVGATCEITAALAIASRATPRQLAAMVFGCTLFWLGLGLMAEFSQGTLRPWEDWYRFAGIFHPNDMGINCALLTMSSLFWSRQAPRWRHAFLALAGVGVIFGYLAASRTALAAMIVALVAAWLIHIAGRRMIIPGLSALLGIVLVTWVLALGMVEISRETLTLDRKDSDVTSLTGRIPLWGELSRFVAERPWSGRGYNSFWSPDIVDEISGSEWGAIASAHSVYLDMVLSLGYVGAALFVFVMGAAVVRSIRREQLVPLAGYGFIATVLIFGLTTGLTETTMGMTGPLSFFAVTGVCMVAFRDVKESRYTLEWS
jgi:O-antigen ligase